MAYASPSDFLHLGEQVFAEHQVGDSFYLIVVGSLAVLMRDQEVKDSTVVSAAELYAGD